MTKLTNRTVEFDLRVVLNRWVLALVTATKAALHRLRTGARNLGYDLRMSYKLYVGTGEFTMSVDVFRKLRDIRRVQKIYGDLSPAQYRALVPTRPSKTRIAAH